MIEAIVEIPLSKVQSKNYELNVDTYGDYSDTCIVCGKRTKGTQKSVQLLTNGNLISSNQEFENSQGFFTVGKDCAKKLTINFSF